MLRNDGDYTIYCIQHDWQNDNDWAYSMENEEYFPPSCDCWQLTGIHGTFDIEEAKVAFEKTVVKQDKNRKFRLVRVDIIQSTKVIA